MKKLHQLVFFISIGWLSFACVDEINLNLDSSNQVMVVDAWLGNLTSETYIRVYLTQPFVSGTLPGFEQQVLMEEILIERKDGVLFPFHIVEDSIYVPFRRFNLIEGEEYRLRFTTVDGESYESPWEAVPPKVEVLDVTTQAFEREVLITTGSAVFLQNQTFADVQLKFKDPGKGPFGYLVETSGISEQFTTSLSDNCECACYLEDDNIFPGMNIRSNDAFEGQEYELKIGEIPLSSLGRYYVSAAIRTVTDFGQEYLSQVDLQQRNTGSIFDPAPFRIKGNIRNVTNPDEVVLGGFFLFQKTEAEKLLFRTDIRRDSPELNHSFEPLIEVGSSCRSIFVDALPTIPRPFLP
jgi:hypothetical protein